SCCNFAYLEICYRNLIIHYQLVKVKCFWPIYKIFSIGLYRQNKKPLDSISPESWEDVLPGASLGWMDYGIPRGGAYQFARRPPAQTEFGSIFSFLCEFLEIIFFELRNSST